MTTYIRSCILCMATIPHKMVVLKRISYCGGVGLQRVYCTIYRMNSSVEQSMHYVHELVYMDLLERSTRGCSRGVS